MHTRKVRPSYLRARGIPSHKRALDIREIDGDVHRSGKDASAEGRAARAERYPGKMHHVDGIPEERLRAELRRPGREQALKFD